jgi:hypothetical protein
MRRRLKIAAWLSAAGIAALALAGFLLYRAGRHVPEFYREALAADPENQRTASHKIEQRAAALASNAQKEGDWHEVFTAEQINGWLAVKLKPWLELELGKSSAEDTLAQIANPRVAITPGQFLLAFKYRNGFVATVVSLTVDVRLDEPNVIALRVRKARAGSLPLPLDPFMKEISAAAGQSGWRIQWSEVQGDPEARISIPSFHTRKNQESRLEALQLNDGELYVAGSTRRRGSAP